MEENPEPHIKFLDGGLGTTLETNHGVKFSESTPLWSSHLLLTDLHTLTKCQSSFARAGANIITTATYQVSINGFRNTKTEDWPNGVPPHKIGPFLHAAVRVARTAASEAGGQVALSLGPYGATMIPSTEYTGQYDIDPSEDMVYELYRWHRDRFTLFEKVHDLLSNVDYIAFETIPRIEEVKAIRECLSIHQVRAPVWISVLFPGDDDKMPDGTSAEDAVTAMIGENYTNLGLCAPQFVGINCTRVSKLGGLVRKFTKTVERLVAKRAVSKWPGLVLCPDGTRKGERYNTETKEWEISEEGSNKEEEDMSWERQLALVIKEAKVSGEWSSIFVGGCCRTTPENISRLPGAFLEVMAEQEKDTTR
ncbi:putative homocysteine S-methyltransferase [Cercophora samala]|uniref:Homocysteine S-methyltransferase n=1 Tax=Cercophora samala TaxID=330535 RepID=A0AA40DEU2_9PEZI|nr:putative homocysteine S-methyltransferase [Cercophora samala]